MSRHYTHARHGDHEVLVVAGYDRPLDELFLQVLQLVADCADVEERVIYSSINEPARDWSSITTVLDTLARLAIDVPISLFEAVYLDQLLNAGSYEAWHPQQDLVQDPALTPEVPLVLARRARA